MTKYIVIWIMTSTIQAPCDYDVTTASMAGTHDDQKSRRCELS